MIKILLHFINDFNYALNEEAVEAYYSSHPDYPSLNAITDTLNFFEIENVAAKIPIEQLSNLPNRFITLLQTSKGDSFIYVTQKKNTSLTYLDENRQAQNISLENFLQQWNPIVLVIDENEKKIERQSIRTSYTLYILMLSFICIIIYNLWIETSLQHLLYSMLSIIGLLLSVLLTQESLGISSSLSSKICGIADTDGSACKTVLLSDGSKIYKNFSLPDACLVFFSSTTILQLFSFNDQYYFPISLLAIPIILYALYYQSIKLKKWCTLCLGVAINLIITILITLIFYHEISFALLLKSSTLFLLALMLVLFAWVNLKPLIQGYFELRKIDFEYKRFKRNQQTFEAMLNTTKTLDLFSLNSLNRIEIGSPISKVKIDLFLSPTCRHCHSAFKEAYNIYTTYPDLCQLNIYFNVNIENQENAYIKVVETITQSYLNNGIDEALQLLKDWHIQNFTLDQWNQKYPMLISDAAKTLIKTHAQWCDSQDLRYTPIRLFNQRLMPNQYSIGDLKYFIQMYET